MNRKAKAKWDGDLKTGNGSLTTDSTVLQDTAYSFKTRFDNGVGTNPEELLAAAHAGCFTMAVSAALTQKGLSAIHLETQATVELDMVKLMITGVHLRMEGKVEGVTAEEFETITKEAEKNCLISKSLNIPITSEAVLLP